MERDEFSQFGEDELYPVSELAYTDRIKAIVLFNKNDNVRERCRCFLRLQVDLDEGGSLQMNKEVRYVNNDAMISIPELVNIFYDLVQDAKGIVDAIIKGNYTAEEGLVGEIPTEIDASISKALGNFNKYKLESFIIELYSNTLIYNKGTDTLQRRKYEKNIQGAMDALAYQNRGNSSSDFM